MFYKSNTSDNSKRCWLIVRKKRKWRKQRDLKEAPNRNTGSRKL
jgi:hypothetical protein